MSKVGGETNTLNVELIVPHVNKVFLPMIAVILDAIVLHQYAAKNAMGHLLLLNVSQVTVCVPLETDLDA